MNRPDQCPQCQSLCVTYHFDDAAKNVFNTDESADFVRCAECQHEWRFKFIFMERTA